MPVIVQKYGGSSVATTDKIRRVAETIIKRKEKGNGMVVVVSAMGDTTDELINLAKGISKKPDKRELDVILSTGEMISSALLAMAIKNMGHAAVSYTAYQIGMKTSGEHGKSQIEDLDISIITKSLNEKKVVIIAGFQGINESGDITTLGRGGSDTTAVALAVKLNGTCEIYTDVDSIYTADPREYSQAKKLKEIDYNEMLELASLGAQVMHPRSIELGQKYEIPIHVGLSCSKAEGTEIKEVNNINMESKPVTGIATSDNNIAITINGIDQDKNILSDISGAIGSKKINMDMISQTAPMDGKVNISFTIPKKDIDECTLIIKNYAETKNIFVDKDITKFSVVGIGMKTTSCAASKMFKLFAENKIDVKLLTTSEIRITCAIKQEDKEKAVNLVAQKFNL